MAAEASCSGSGKDKLAELRTSASSACDGFLIGLACRASQYLPAYDCKAPSRAPDGSSPVSRS